MRQPPKRELLPGWKLVTWKPAELGDVVGGLGVAIHDRRFPDEVENSGVIVTRPVPIEVHAEELARLDLDARLLAELSTERGERLLVLVQEASWGVPATRVGLVSATRQEQPPFVVDDESRDRGYGVRVLDEAACSTLDASLLVRQLRSTARAEEPAGQDAHAGTVLTPCRPDTSPRQ